jgi:hypothetical protein
MRATIIRVEFADEVRPGEEPDEQTPGPTVDDLTWSPDIPLREEGWLVLPAGSGELTVSVRAEHADRVELVLTPTGTDMAPYAQVIPMTGDGHGSWTAPWEYDDEPVLAHLGLRAVGPGGTANVDVFGVTKE